MDGEVSKTISDGSLASYGNESRLASLIEVGQLCSVYG